MLGTAGQYTWTHALKRAEASSLAPLSYLQLVFVALCAWLAFGETPNRWTVLGAAIVIGASLYIARREARLARERRTAPPVEKAEPQI